MTEALDLDLAACATEPIHIPGGIQPHGALLVVEPGTGSLLQMSENAPDFLGLPLTPGEAVTRHFGARTRAWISGGDGNLFTTEVINGESFDLLGHRSSQGMILEMEPPLSAGGGGHLNSYPRLQAFADTVTSLTESLALAALLAQEIQALTQFNRVLVYDFDRDWHGTVLAESSDGVLPSYLNLRFPASDIPEQARELYRVNPVRLIPDANYLPVPIVPALSPVDGKPVDLSFAALRSVSPVHLEYMRNMGTMSSMSFSIIVEDRLWGLVSCHHQSARRAPAEIRTACNFLVKIASLQFGSIARNAHQAQLLGLKRVETELVTRLSRAASIGETLKDHTSTWLALTGATGVAVVTPDRIDSAGETPSEEQLRALADWLAETGEDVHATDALSAELPAAAAFSDCASGIIAASISQIHTSYVIWFRPEIVRTVNWSGDPRKPVEPGAGRLRPRHSFAQWQELVRQRSRPWTSAEITSVKDFRDAMLNLVLRRAEERAELTEELERSNRELESFSYSVSHDLRAPFRHIVGYSELLREHQTDLDDKSRHYLSNIIGAALSAGQLVDDLLAFSQLGRANVEKARVDMKKLVEEVQRSLEPDLVGRSIRWKIGTLPAAWGDGALLRQALGNLIENAVKYSRGRAPAEIAIAGRDGEDETTYWVADNGIGFEMTYVDKLFGVFQRLHRAEDFEGTGIGLALTKRVIQRHGGRIWAEAQIDRGATFTFTLPKRPGDIHHD